MKRMYEYTVKRTYIGPVNEEASMYQIKTPDSVAQYLKEIPDFYTADQESFIVLILDTRNQVKGYSRITTGLIDRSSVHPREVLRPALIQGGAKNHNLAQPSKR